MAQDETNDLGANSSSSNSDGVISEERLDFYQNLANKEYLGDVEPSVEPYVRGTFTESMSPSWFFHTPNGMFRAPNHRNLDRADVTCLGVPMDIGTPNQRSGSRLGPQELRKWSINQGPSNPETGVSPFELARISDWGDVRLSRAPYNLETSIEELTDVYRTLCKHEITPLSIGGEHTLTYSALCALGETEPLSVIHFDAHPDTRTGGSRTGSDQGTAIHDGNIFTQAACNGVIDPERCVQIGLRGRSLEVARFSDEAGMTMIPATEFRERGLEDILAEILEVVGEAPCYLTIDTDVFDPSAMPGTTLPEPFGLTGWEVRDVLRGLRKCNIVGADLTELSPTYDPTGKSGCLAAGIAFEELCLLAEAHAERTGETRQTEWR